MNVTETEAASWFQKCQLEAVIRNGVVPHWFHGIITRKASEELLLSKPPGYFLIRVSESRIGYTLSYRAEDRCRHFMIDASKDGYILLGDDRHHRLLEDLVDFHRKFPIKTFNELLTLPCGQISDGNTDYEELLFPEGRCNPSPSVQQMQAQRSIKVPDVPPIHPSRLCLMVDSAAQPSDGQSARLYPSLDFLGASPHLQLPETVPASRASHTTISASSSLPPKLPFRNVSPVPLKSKSCIKTKCALPSLPKERPVDSITAVVTNLKKFKKKLQRKSHAGELSVYEEVVVKEEVKPETCEYNEVGDRQIIQDELSPYSSIPARAAFPPEYHSPPPFAPGYT